MAIAQFATVFEVFNGANRSILHSLHTFSKNMDGLRPPSYGLDQKGEVSKEEGGAFRDAQGCAECSKAPTVESKDNKDFVEFECRKMGCTVGKTFQRVEVRTTHDVHFVRVVFHNDLTFCKGNTDAELGYDNSSRGINHDEDVVVLENASACVGVKDT